MRSIFLAVVLIGAVRGAITGQRSCNQYMCITGTRDSDTNQDTYTLGPPQGVTIPFSQFGWMAIGFGTQMGEPYTGDVETLARRIGWKDLSVDGKDYPCDIREGVQAAGGGWEGRVCGTGSPMVMVWPNSDGSITLSQRQANGHVMPQVTSSPPRVATLQTSRSFSNSSSTSITFTIPSNSDSTSNSTNLIWAYSESKPSSSAASASISQHNGRGLTVLALMTPLTSTAATSASSGTAGPSGTSSAGGPAATNAPGTISDAGAGSSSLPFGSQYNLVIAHVVCGALAAMLFVPIGVLTPRLARGFSGKRWWFPLHSVNGLLALLLVVIGFSIAVSRFGGGFDTIHRKLGLAFFILLVLQAVLGAAVHWIKSCPHAVTSRDGRGPSNYVHVLLGLAVMSIGWATVYYGITSEWRARSGTGAPSNGWLIGWAIIVGVVSILYIVGLVWLLPKQLARERSSLEVRQGASPTDLERPRKA